VLFDALSSSLQNNNQQQQKQMQNRVDLELQLERKEQFFELEKGSLKSFF
jgi:hypothetical protein